MTDLPTIKFLDRRTPPHVATLVVLAGMAALAMNVFLPSLPNMATYYQADYAFMQLAVALYLGVNAVLQLFIGPCPTGMAGALSCCGQRDCLHWRHWAACWPAALRSLWCFA